MWVIVIDEHLYIFPVELKIDDKHTAHFNSIPKIHGKKNRRNILKVDGVIFSLKKKISKTWRSGQRMIVYVLE